MNTPEQALQAALKVAGGFAQLGRAIGASRQRVFQWTVAPPEMVIAIERATGISRHDLRPDIYPDESAQSNGARAEAAQ